jgi:hypothetical protein
MYYLIISAVFPSLVLRKKCFKKVLKHARCKQSSPKLPGQYTRVLLVTKCVNSQQKEKKFADMPVVNLYSFIPHGIEVR